MATKETGGEIVHTETEFDRFYAFYQGLEQQERQSKLKSLIVLCTALVALMVAVWTIQHPVTLNQLMTPSDATTR